MQCLAFIIDSYVPKFFVFIVWSFLFLKQECTVEYACVTHSVADLEFTKGGFQYAIKARVARLLGGSGGMPPPGKFYDF